MSKARENIEKLRSIGGGTVGDMLKSEFATNGNAGVVDNSEKFNGQDPEYYLSYGSNQDTEANILASDPTTRLNQTWWATDTKIVYKAFTSVTEGLDIWQPVEILYDPSTDTYKLPPTQDGQTQNVGQENFLSCYTTETLPINTTEPAVFLITGIKAGEENIKEAVLPIASDLSSGAIVGINTTNPNTAGYFKISVFGDLNGVNTSPWSEKAILYADPVTPGLLTSTKPFTNAYAIAIVLVSDAVVGKLFINTVRAVSDAALASPAGLDRLWFTGDLTDAGDPAGLDNFFLIKRSDQGIVLSATTTALVPDNSTVGVLKSHIGSQFIANVNILAGGYRFSTEYTISNTGAKEVLHLEIYLASADGTVVDSGTGLPNGSLGVPPVGVGSSGSLNGAANTPLFDGLIVDVLTPVPGLVGQRLVYHIRAQKDGGAGGDKLFTFFYGSDSRTFIEAPRLIAFGDLVDVDIQAGQTNDVAVLGSDSIWRNTPSTSLLTGRMLWKGLWVAGTYIKDDVVKDGDWLTIANKTTTDRPMPLLNNSPAWTWDPTPAWNTQTELGDIWYGFQFTIIQMIEITGWRIWVTGDVNDSYVASLYDYNNSSNPILIGSQIVPAGQPAGWFEVTEPLKTSTVYAGEVFRLVVQAHSIATDTPYSHQWRWLFGGTDPGGGTLTYDTGNTRLKINENGQGANLLLLKEEDTITLTETADSSLWTSYRVTGQATDEGTWISVPAVVVAIGGSIRDNRDVVTEWIVKGGATNTNYVEDINGIPNYTPNTSTKGFVTNDPNLVLDPALLLNDNIYGADLFSDLYIASPDWDVLTANSGGGAASNTIVSNTKGTSSVTESIWTGTDAEYQALPAYNASTLYFIEP